MSDDNIIEFPSGDPDLAAIKANGVKKSTTTQTYCKHRAVELDQATRTITCSSCDAIVEPFDWALSLLDKSSRFFDQYQTLKSELSQKRKDLKVVLTEEKKAKARLRNARKSLSEQEKKAEFNAEQIADAKQQIKLFREGD